MRLLLCNLETGEFYRTPGLWVQRPDEAAAFADMQCLLNELRHIPRANLAAITLDEEDRPIYGVRLWRFEDPKSGH